MNHIKTNLTNFNIGEGKRVQMLKSFGVTEDVNIMMEGVVDDPVLKVVEDLLEKGGPGSGRHKGSAQATKTDLYSKKVFDNGSYSVHKHGSKHKIKVKTDAGEIHYHGDSNLEDEDAAHGLMENIKPNKDGVYKHKAVKKLFEHARDTAAGGESKVEEHEDDVKDQLAKLHEKDPEKFFEVISKHYEPEDDGESEHTMLENLAKHPAAEKILKELKKSNISFLKKAFDSLFEGDDILEKAFGKLDTSHLVLKEIRPGVKRWVDPNKSDKEYAPEGHRAKFNHKGGIYSGTVGKVHPTKGHYEIHGDDGKKYEKLSHHISDVEPPKEKAVEKQSTAKNETSNPDAKHIEVPEGSTIKKYLGRRSTPELVGLINSKTTHADDKKVIHDILNYREVEGYTGDGKSGDVSGKANVEGNGTGDTGTGGGNGIDGKGDTGNGKGEGGAAAIDKKAKADEKELDEEGKPKGKFYHDINKRFQVYEDLVDDVINGHAIRSLLVYGAGGVGKSFTVTKALKDAGMVAYKPKQFTYSNDDEGNKTKEKVETSNSDGHEKGSEDYDYVVLKGGKTTPAALYRNMYEHNGKLIIMDDNDNVLKDDTAINMLKGALDTKDRRVSNETNSALKDEAGNPIPTTFKFNGKMIIISNIKANNEKLQPLKSRSSKIDMTMTPDQTIDRIEHIAKDKNGKFTKLDFSNDEGEKGESFEYKHADAEKVFKFMRQHKDEFGDDLSVRTVKTLLALKQRADKRGIDPDDYMETHLLSKANESDLTNAFDGLIGDVLVKAEGARGGHVIGHTKSGNPIYGQPADKKKVNGGLI